MSKNNNYKPLDEDKENEPITDMTERNKLYTYLGNIVNSKGEWDLDIKRTNNNRHVDLCYYLCLLESEKFSCNTELSLFEKLLDFDIELLKDISPFEIKKFFEGTIKMYRGLKDENRTLEEKFHVLKNIRVEQKVKEKSIATQISIMKGIEATYNIDGNRMLDTIASQYLYNKEPLKFMREWALSRALEFKTPQKNEILLIT